MSPTATHIMHFLYFFWIYTILLYLGLGLGFDFFFFLYFEFGSRESVYVIFFLVNFSQKNITRVCRPKIQPRESLSFLIDYLFYFSISIPINSLLSTIPCNKNVETDLGALELYLDLDF